MSLLIFIRRQAIGVLAVGQGVLLGSAMVLTVSGCGENYMIATPGNSIRSTEAILSVELGEPESMVMGRLQCEGRELVSADRLSGAAQTRVACPHEPLISHPGEWGRLEVSFRGGRASEVLWTQDRDDLPVEQIRSLGIFLRELWSSEPMYTNDLDDESLEDALHRGEWHERWHLRGGVLLTYFARVELPGQPRYKWVIASKRGGAQSN